MDTSKSMRYTRVALALTQSRTQFKYLLGIRYSGLDAADTDEYKVATKWSHLIDTVI